jgi:hypothetical protein
MDGSHGDFWFGNLLFAGTGSRALTGIAARTLPHRWS